MSALHDADIRRAEYRPHLRPASLSLPPSLSPSLSPSLALLFPYPSSSSHGPKTLMLEIYPTLGHHAVHAPSLSLLPLRPPHVTPTNSFNATPACCIHPIYRCDQGPIPIPTRAKDDLFISDPTPTTPYSPTPPWAPIAIISLLGTILHHGAHALLLVSTLVLCTETHCLLTGLEGRQRQHSSDLRCSLLQHQHQHLWCGGGCMC